jgi:hypothetical protein
MTIAFNTTVYKTISLTASSQSSTTYHVTLSETIGVETTSHTTFYVTDRYIEVHRSPVDVYAPPIVTGIVVAIGSWLVNRSITKSNAAREKREKRKEKVYAPLFDELPKIRKAFEEYTYTNPIEYRKISSEHLFYLIPKSLSMKIHELYDQDLECFGQMAISIRDKYRKIILEDITKSVPIGQSPNAFNDSNANTLATDLAFFLLRGKITNEWITKAGLVFQDVKGRLGLKETTITEYFEKLLELRSKDAVITDIETLREKGIRLAESIEQTIAKDLET